MKKKSFKKKRKRKLNYSNHRISAAPNEKYSYVKIIIVEKSYDSHPNYLNCYGRRFNVIIYTCFRSDTTEIAIDFWYDFVCSINYFFCTLIVQNIISRFRWKPYVASRYINLEYKHWWYVRVHVYTIIANRNW